MERSCPEEDKKARYGVKPVAFGTMRNDKSSTKVKPLSAVSDQDIGSLILEVDQSVVVRHTHPPVSGRRFFDLNTYTRPGCDHASLLRGFNLPCRFQLQYTERGTRKKNSPAMQSGWKTLTMLFSLYCSPLRA